VRVETDPVAMQRTALAWRGQSVRVALVPTMGYLHEGHLSLVRIAREHADVVVVSLFVNPTQFAPNEDLDRYPRDFERDCDLCEREGVDVLFAPGDSGVYAADASVTVEENRLSLGLCGGSRPGHFSGVLTVVAKLFNLVLPDTAVFGEKDAQQLRLIRRMVRDLNFPVEVRGGPIIREADGLAMSSRNKNLSSGEREQATVLDRALSRIREAAEGGERKVSALRRIAAAEFNTASLGEVDYLEFVDDETLEPVETLGERPVLVAAAFRFPGARLIDNRTIRVGL